MQKRPTIKDAAKLMQVSERRVYYARKLRRSGRADLIEAARRGEITLHAALRIAYPPPPKDGLRALLRAWRTATEEERGAFLQLIEIDQCDCFMTNSLPSMPARSGCWQDTIT